MPGALPSTLQHVGMAGGGSSSLSEAEHPHSGDAPVGTTLRGHPTHRLAVNRDPRHYRAGADGRLCESNQERLIDGATGTKFCSTIFKLLL